MTISVQQHADKAAVAKAAAEALAVAARRAVDARGKFTLALSGGSTPWSMLEAWAGLDVPWAQVFVFQVDERAAPPGSDERNRTHIEKALLSRVPIPGDQFLPMPVESGPGSDADRAYVQTLTDVCGGERVLDVVQLGLGSDGHTASLVPDDDVCGVRDVDVAWTAGLYQGCRRLTLTYPVLDRARMRLWLVAGADKAPAVAKLLDADASIPGGSVSQESDTVLYVDDAAFAGR